MSYVLGLKCKECGHRAPIKPLHVCEQCFGPYEVEYDYARMKGKVTRESIQKGPKSLWRYKDFLPVEKPVTGFKGRSGKSFRARLALQQNEEGKWRVEFDEPWAKEGFKPPEAEAETAEAA